MQNATDAAWGRWLPAHAAVNVVDANDLVRNCVSDDDFEAMLDRRDEAGIAVLEAPIVTMLDVARKLAVTVATCDDDTTELEPHIAALLRQVAKAEQSEPEPA